MKQVLGLVSGVLSVYMIILFIRIIMSWFSSPNLGKATEILNRVTDPYLGLFRRFSFLRSERLDFTPIAAIIVLVILLNIVNTLAVQGQITIGLILALIVAALWSAFSFLLTFIVILVAVRFFALVVGIHSVSPFWTTLDTILNPFLRFVQTRLFRGREMSYQAGLGLSGLVFLSSAIVGRLLIAQLVRVLQMIPF